MCGKVYAALSSFCFLSPDENESPHGFFIHELLLRMSIENGERWIWVHGLNAGLEEVSFVSFGIHCLGENPWTPSFSIRNGMGLSWGR